MTVVRDRRQTLPRTIWAATLPLAAVLQGASTLLWTSGQFEYSPTSATLLALSLVAWVVGFVGVIETIRPRMPITAAAILPLMVYCAMGGINFAFRGFYETAAGIGHEAGLRTLGSVPLQANDALLLIPFTLVGVQQLRIGRGSVSAGDA